MIQLGVYPLWRAVILGIVEGLTEFLPISSTGHLIITMPLLGINGDEQPWPVFLFFIQIGAILAVIVYFARDLWQRMTEAPGGGALWNHLLTKLLVAFMPAAIVGYTLNNWMERHLEAPIPVACALILGAGVMEWVDRRFRTSDGSPGPTIRTPDGNPGPIRTPDASPGPTMRTIRIRTPDASPGPHGAPGHGQSITPYDPLRRTTPTGSIDQISLRQAFLIGVAQCVSIIPGTSRAMATIMGGMIVGLTPSVATQFSFYLAIPTLLAAGGYKLFKHRGDIHAHEAGLLFTGTAVSFVVALLVVAWFLRYVARHRFRLFAVYRIILGALVLLYWTTR